LKKKWLVAGALILTVALTAGCTPKGESGNAGKVTLMVYNWGEYMDPDILTQFEEETGIHINYEVYPTNEEMYVKLTKGGTDYDLIFPSDYMVERLIAEERLTPLDFDKLPNFQYIAGQFRNMDYDPDNAYSVPYFWGTLGILYNTNLVTEPVDSWHILWDEQYADQILMLDSFRDSFAPALRLLGYSLNTTDPAQLQEAQAMLVDQKPLVLAYVVDEVNDMMIGEEASLALVWSGAAVSVMQENPDMAYAVPREGSNVWVDCMVIPKTCQHIDEVHQFIDYLCRPDIALQNTEWVGYSTPNSDVIENIDPEMSSMEAYNPPEDVLDHCDVFLDMPADTKELYGELWTEIKAE
jgi:spermidine/putrescine transport system substrate-binding protein